MKATDLNAPRKEGAGCMLVSLDTNKFLLIQRSQHVPAPMTWSLPGGGVDPGESPEIAARREVMEETGFDLGDRPLGLLYVNEVHAPRFRFYTYAAAVDKEFPPTLNWESMDYLWCDLDDLPGPLHWGLSQLLSHNRAGKRLVGFVEKQKKSHSS